MMNETTPKISVIVPVYKAEAYLHRCVDSILAQTFQDFEVLLVNDGSPDKSGEICDEYARKDKRIKVIHNINQGVVAARNCGVRKSIGEWFTFVDSDDFMPIDALENLLYVTSVIDTNIVVGYFNDIIPISEQTVLSPADYSRESIIGTSRIVTNIWAKLFHRSLVKDDSVLVLPQYLIQGEDMLVNIRLSFVNEKPVVLVPFSVYCYDTENVMSCMHTFVPTIEYIEKFHDLLYQSVPQEERERFRGYLLKARVNSLHFLTIRGDVKWKRSLFFSDMKRHLGEIKLSFREEMLIRMPHIYKLIYMMYRYIK